MAIAADGAMSPVTAFALIGALGVGAQWLAWRLRLPAIVLMLAAGLMVGPVLGILDPTRDIGSLMGPMISVAVAIILFEGGITLNFHALGGAAKGVRRLVIVGAPLGWLLSTLALRYVAGLDWGSAAVFGGIMIVTGPTVIAPLLRQARMQRRPAALLQWEAIVNDPVGALAAVLAFQVVVVLQTGQGLAANGGAFVIGLVFAALVGVACGWGTAQAFRRALVPEYMKVPVLFVVLLACFAASDAVLHESGLLAVTLMGLWIANADLPSYVELRRFKEHATILLVSGVFILLAAAMQPETLALLDWRALAFVVVVIVAVRPLTVLISLLGTDLPWAERLLVAFTGPRGVVLVAVAGLFGERLVSLGVEDAARIGPLAFALVAGTVVLHGFTLTPMARALGVASREIPGVLLVGGSKWAAAFGEALQSAEVPVLVLDGNHARLRSAREAGVPVFYGDILSEAAEHGVEIMSYGKVIAATDNDAYNTLVATDLAPEFGRDNVFQLQRVKQESARHAMPATLGGRALGQGQSYFELNLLISEGWAMKVTRLSEEFTAEDWAAMNPRAILLARLQPNGDLRLHAEGKTLEAGPDTRLVAMVPPENAVS
ncbi:sodium:proton exchanger [Actibacterium mucosum KCTC 23349]|uniref:Sodium:proton exchanger n=1 Tax=Actibacterium mucosum KCTC 23349 TaxID=1454373 RepID=A0A037ZP71_9RHOB|nr:sodium:proton antiporter [Actibacterium mucosum]KAJ56626.1 sodium:proton exchanger [Actibacterium mucosum KCTC 23349]